jgi:uncharacterized protein (DUF1499 family)
MKNAISVAAVFSLALSAGISGCSGTAPGNLGVKDGRLSPCPATPNCVSSLSTDAEHAEKPLTYTRATPAARAELKKLLLGMKRAKITAETGAYLRAEFTSALFRFVDDVEFYIDENAKVIHVRSASRLGKSDLGVNRKRIEAIRAAWEKAKTEQGR